MSCEYDCMLEHIMRCVLMTPLGVPVDPEVNRIFATVSGPTCANALSARVVGFVSQRLRKLVAFKAGVAAVTSSGPDIPSRITVGDALPLAIRPTFAQEGRVRCRSSPMFQPVADAARVRAQVLRAFKHDGAVGARCATHRRPGDRKPVRWTVFSES